MNEFIEKLIGRLEEEIQDVSESQSSYEVGSDMSITCSHIMGTLRDVKNRIIPKLAEEYKGGWIACTVVDHPEHCNDCEVTFKDMRGYGRDIAFYTDKWRRSSDELPILVVAWKEPSAPYNPKGE